MANPFSKGWKYLMASFDKSIDENADPKVQIHQAAEAAKDQHRQITEQAAAIIGNKKQLELKMDRLLKSQQEQQARTQQALKLADDATVAGDAQKAQEYNNTAEVLASQLVSVEAELEDTKKLYAQASQAADEATRQQQQSEARLKQQLAETDKLSAQADQAAMHEKTVQAVDSMNAVTGDDNVPTLDDVRSKIEKRYADALGAQELASTSTENRIAEITAAGNDLKATSRLEEIRAQMNGEKQLTDEPRKSIEE